MISIENLVKEYGQTRAVSGINFEIPSGQVLGLLGPNGAGKSTTLRILTGYLQPTSGTIKVNGIDVTENPVEVKKLIGYLPESAPLYPDMLVFDYLNYSSDLRGLDKDMKKKRIRELAGLCGIGDVMHKPIRTLSKGYKQRVGLAHALMDDPEILVLDEPTSGLDPNQIVEIRSIIKDIGKEKTIIFSTHILSEAEAACSRVVIINKGNVAADGPVEMLKSGEKNRQVIELTVKGGDKAEDLNNLFSGSELYSINDTVSATDSVTVKLACSGDQREAVYGRIKDSDLVLLEMVQQKQTLENIFRELTREQNV